MAEFEIISTEIDSKEIDNDTYFLVPLEKKQEQEQKIFVMSKNFDENLKLILYSMPELTNDEKTHSNIMDTINNLNFYEKFVQILTNCFPNEDVVSSLFSEAYNHHILVSKNNILQLARSVLMSLYKNSIDLEFNDIIQPYGILTLEEWSGDGVEIRKIKGGDWETTKYYMIYNVCKNSNLDKTNICTNMINMVVNSNIYGQYPIFLFVDKENVVAQKCYMKNKFQVVKDVFSGKINQYNENSIYMCHNKYDLRVKTPDNSEFHLMPTDAYRFTLVAHGAIQADQRNIFQPNFTLESIFREYYFPFKNAQYYVQKGVNLAMPSEISEQTGMLDVCYETLVPDPEQTEIPENGIIKTLPMFYEGFKEESDPKERAEFIGLYDCIRKERIASNE